MAAVRGRGLGDCAVWQRCKTSARHLTYEPFTITDEESCGVDPSRADGAVAGSSGAAGRARNGVHWLALAVILTTDMVGVGTLGLPADFARLGWLPAILTMLLFMGGGVYSGSVYQRLSLRVPNAVVFDEIGFAGER